MKQERSSSTEPSPSDDRLNEESVRWSGTGVSCVLVEVLIDAPRDRVWARYSDHCSWAEWAGVGPVRLDATGVPPPNGVGCVRVVGPGPFGAHEEIVSFEPPSRMTYKLTKGIMPLENHFGEVVFEDAGDSTAVRWRCRFDCKSRVKAAILERVVRRVFQRALDGLARDLTE